MESAAGERLHRLHRQRRRGVPLAVLTDSAATSVCDEGVTASAYDLQTGEQRWGPVDVPGPLRGPGTIFSAPGAEAAEAVILDPATGAPVAGTNEASRFLGEYRGTILSIDGDTLIATADGAEVWESSLADNGWGPKELRARPGTDPGSNVIDLDDGGGTGPVVDRTSGELLDDDVRAVSTGANNEAVVTLGTRGLRVIGESGKNDLPASVPKSVGLEAAAGGLIYLREGGTLRVHNAATGSIARGYPADGSGIVAVPDAFTTEGTGTLRAGDRTMLATDRVIDEAQEP